MRPLRLALQVTGITGLVLVGIEVGLPYLEQLIVKVWR